VKGGPRPLLSVAFPTGVLSASTTVERPRTSERRRDSWRREVNVPPMRVRKPIVLVHSSVVVLRREQATKHVHVVSISEGQREREGGGENATHNAPYLGGKFMNRSFDFRRKHYASAPARIVSTYSTRDRRCGLSITHRGRRALVYIDERNLCTICTQLVAARICAYVELITH